MKYQSGVGMTTEGKWFCVLKGQRFRIEFNDIDDAVDALLMEESFACARIADGHAGKHALDSSIATELRTVAQEIRDRAEQKLAGDP